MRTLPCLLGLVLAFVPSVAHSECAVRYQLPTLARDLGTMQSSLRNLDETTFRDAGEQLKLGLPCMGTAAPVQIYASAYRLLGALYHLQGDTEQGEAWFRSAIELDSGFSWDVRDFDVGHPIRTSYDTLGAQLDTVPSPVSGQQLVAPPGSTLLIDGRSLDEAAATTDRPHLVQQVGSDGAIVNTWVIDGNAFPAALLQPAGADPEPSSLVTGEEAPEESSRKETRRERQARAGQPAPVVDTSGSPLDEVVAVERLRPPMKTPLLVIGGVGLAGAGGTYAASYVMQQRFQEATTTDEIESLRATTNALVLGAGGAALLGVGLGYWGVLLDGGVGLSFSRQF